MRAVPFDDVVTRVCALMAIPRNQLLSDEETLIVSHLNKAIRRGWEAADWPELRKVEERAPASNIISLDQVGETAIGEVYGVYLDNPYLTRYPRPQRYELTADGIQLIGETVTGTVWVDFRIRPTVYAAGDTTDVPYILSEYAAHAAYSDMLRGDGQDDKAAQAAMEAEGLLSLEFDKLERQQGQQPRWQVRTHISSQAR